MAGTELHSRAMSAEKLQPIISGSRVSNCQIRSHHQVIRLFDWYFNSTSTACWLKRARNWKLSLQWEICYTAVHCEAKKLHPFIFSITLLNKSTFYFDNFGRKGTWMNLQRNNDKILMNVITLPCDNNMCQTLHNHSNACIKQHDKLTVTDKHITTNVQSACLWLWHAHYDDFATD